MIEVAKNPLMALKKRPSFWVTLHEETFRNQLYLGIGQLACHLSLIYVVLEPSAKFFAGSIFVYFLMTSVGVSITAHRYLSHSSFHMPKVPRWFGLLCFTLSMQGSSIAWVAMHREHHRYSDRPKDPHCPRPSFWRTHFLSMFYVPKLRYVTQLVRTREQQFFHRQYWTLNLAFSALLFFAGGFKAVVYLHLFPAFLCWQAISVAKTFAHMGGYRNFATQDTSHNIPIFGYLTFGEAWHNNHHAFPTRTSFKSRWHEWDISGGVVQFFIWTRVFTPNQIED